MALNMDKVRNKLASFDKNKKGGKKSTPTESQEKIKKYIWKPEPGKQVVRIVPYQFQPDFPFIELKWHYDFNGDKVSYLSPASQNKPDPIVELANRLEKVKETWLKGRKMQPKLRTYVPIIVRGKEEEGVKFWGFGVQVCEQLMSAIEEPDFGDITDLVNGYDIQVDFKTAEEVKKDFPETKILIKPKPRPVIDPEHPKAKEILELISKKQVNIFDIYTLATYEDLVAALETKLENERQGITVAASPRGAERVVAEKTETQTASSDDDTPATITEQAVASTTTVPVAEIQADSKPVVSPSAAKASKAVKPEDFESAFNNLFNK
jgi:gp32 DNA binding protein like